jgi:hypothetical protein
MGAASAVFSYCSIEALPTASFGFYFSLPHPSMYVSVMVAGEV